MALCPKKKHIEREHDTIFLSDTFKFRQSIKLKKITAIHGEGSNRTRWLELAKKNEQYLLYVGRTPPEERRRNKLLITLAGGCGMIII